MSPVLERETNIKSIVFTKFLRYGKVIIYDFPGKNHSEIAEEHGFGESVDDGGYISPVGDYPYEVIRFNRFTQTCTIQSDRREQRKQTIQIAKNILGEDKVSD